MIDLPTCSPLAAAAASRLAPRLPVAFAVGGAAVVAAMPARHPPAPPGDWARIAARIGGHRVELLLDPDLLPRAAVERWPEIEAVGVPDDLRAVLRRVLLAELSELAESWSGLPLDWEDAGEAEPPNLLLLLREGPAGTPVGFARLDDRAFHWLAERCAPLPARLAALEALPPATLDLTLDRLRLSARELRDLAPGDTILLDRSPVEADGALRVVAGLRGGPGYRALIIDGRLHILAALDAAMDHPEAVPAASFDDIPMEVECEVGRLTLPLSRLREIAVGQVFDLGFDATAAVSLRVNGQVVAVGELVRIAERVGIRVLEVRTGGG